MLLRTLPLGLGTAAREVRGVVHRLRRNALLTALAGLCFATAYVAAIVAVGAALAPVYGPAIAALIIAGGMILAGLLFVSVLAFLKHRDRRRRLRQQAAQRLTIAAALSVLPQLTKSKGLLVAAALGGLALLASQGLGDEESG
ncbi:hypothetical protein [Roseibium sp. M-1]